MSLIWVSSTFSFDSDELPDDDDDELLDDDDDELLDDDDEDELLDEDEPLYNFEAVAAKLNILEWKIK